MLVWMLRHDPCFTAWQRTQSDDIMELQRGLRHGTAARQRMWPCARWANAMDVLMMRRPGRTASIFICGEAMRMRLIMLCTCTDHVHTRVHCRVVVCRSAQL